MPRVLFGSKRRGKGRFYFEDCESGATWTGYLRASKFEVTANLQLEQRRLNSEVPVRQPDTILAAGKGDGSWGVSGL